MSDVPSPTDNATLTVAHRGIRRVMVGKHQQTLSNKRNITCHVIEDTYPILCTQISHFRCSHSRLSHTEYAHQNAREYSTQSVALSNESDMEAYPEVEVECDCTDTFGV